MDPSSEELVGMKTIADICDWVGLVDGIESDSPRRMARSGFLDALGRPQLVRQLVAIPAAAYEAVAAAWKIKLGEEEVSPSPVERGHPGMIRRVARLLLKLDPDEVGPVRQRSDACADPGGASTATVPLPDPPGAGQEGVNGKSHRPERRLDPAASCSSSGPRCRGRRCRRSGSAALRPSVRPRAKR